MDPARADDPAKADDSVEADNVTGDPPVSPEDVVKYLVQNGPLTHVADISRFIDGYKSELRQNSFAVESLNTAVDMEKEITSSIDGLLREFRGFYSTVGKRMKETGNVLDTRSQDLRNAIARLHSTPLTTPPVSSSTAAGPSIAQTSTQVEEIGMAQTEVLNALEVSRDKLKVALGELSNRGKSMKPLLDTFMKEAHRPSPSPFGRNEPRRADYTAHPMHTRTPLALQLYDSLWERYQRGSLEFQSGVDRIVKNSETIRDLALILERARDLDVTIAPPMGRFTTLADELSAQQTLGADTSMNVLPDHNQVLQSRSPVARFESLKVWAECSIRNRLLSLRPHVRSSFLVSTSLVVLLVLANMMRARYRVGDPDHGQGTSKTQTSSSIREILLGDKMNIPDVLIRNLVPRGDRYY